MWTHGEQFTLQLCELPVSTVTAEVPNATTEEEWVSDIIMIVMILSFIHLFIIRFQFVGLFLYNQNTYFHSQ